MLPFSGHIHDVTPKGSSKWQHTYDHQAATDSRSPQLTHLGFFALINTLSASHTLGTGLGCGDSAANETVRAPALMEHTV